MFIIDGEQMLEDEVETTSSKPTNVKFSDQRIDDLFKMLNQEIDNKKLGHEVLKPISKRTQFWDYNRGYIPAIDKLRQWNQEGIIDGIDVNAMGIVNAGNSYDGTSNEERTETAKSKVLKIVEAINEALSRSPDPLFSRLQCELKSKNLRLCYTKKDKYDDGFDTFGMEFFLKIFYKK